MDKLVGKHYKPSKKQKAKQEKKSKDQISSKKNISKHKLDKNNTQSCPRSLSQLLAEQTLSHSNKASTNDSVISSEKEIFSVQNSICDSEPTYHNNSSPGVNAETVTLAAASTSDMKLLFNDANAGVRRTATNNDSITNDSSIVVGSLHRSDYLDAKQEVEKLIKERERYALGKDGRKKEIAKYQKDKEKLLSELQQYEIEKKKKKEKLRSEIDDLRKERDELKVGLKFDQLRQESELLEKQKQINEFEERLLNRHENIYEREKSLKSSLEELEESEHAMDRRRDILKRKQEELTNIAHTQDLDNLQKQLTEQKLNLKRKSMDGNIQHRERAQLNWTFVRSIFQDRTAMMETILKETRAQVVHLENQLRERNREITKYEAETELLKQTVKRKDKKIRELEQHLTLTLQSQAENSPQQSTESKSVNFSTDTVEENTDPREDNRGYFSRRQSTRKSINGDTMKMNYDFNEDKYVSQTCHVM